MNNYCTRCQSFYNTPGSCNCYAQTQPRLPWTYIGDPLPNMLPWAPAPTTFPFGNGWTLCGGSGIPANTPKDVAFATGLKIVANDG